MANRLFDYMYIICNMGVVLKMMGKLMSAEVVKPNSPSPKRVMNTIKRSSTYLKTYISFLNILREGKATINNVRKKTISIFQGASENPFISVHAHRVK